MEDARVRFVSGSDIVLSNITNHRIREICGISYHMIDTPEGRSFIPVTNNLQMVTIPKHKDDIRS